MNFTICESLTNYRQTLESPLYFSKAYLDSQDLPQLVIAESDHFILPFNVENQQAISISRSPFGSIHIKSDYLPKELKGFHEQLKKSLQSKGVTTIQIKHPPPIYSDFVRQNELELLGYHQVYEDINQHIDLDESWENSIHTMQKRKLKSLREEGFTFKVLKDFEKAYQFVNVCRQTQGLQINIKWSHLESLISRLPGRYECFSVERGGKLSAICIAVNVSTEVVYYYLPATSPLFRSQSPMVLLIAGMVDYYRSKQFKYLDLGVSSVEGRPQETLKLFKERMGAKQTKKSFLELSL